ncbi:MAG: helix-turn-helix domain-containing protein [Phycisphaerales bacterium]|nr:helix-turn-helix domain-containing protein [Phycisphaerales bacterium]
MTTLMLTFPETAKTLRYCVKKLQNDIGNGRFGPRVHRFGRSVRISADELREWIAAGSPPRAEWERRPANAAQTKPLAD